MPINYVSIREKVLAFFTSQILPKIKKQEVDYNKVIGIIVAHTGIRRNIVQEIIDSQIEGEIIKENRILTMPDRWFAKKLEIEKEADDIFKEHVHNDENDKLAGEDSTK